MVGAWAIAADACIGSAICPSRPRAGLRPMPGAGCSIAWELKPVAITVMRTSSPAFASMTEPKMMFASGSAASAIRLHASFTSASVRSGPPVMLIRMPVAPLIDTSSSSGELIACCAASIARLSPLP